MEHKGSVVVYPVLVAKALNIPHASNQLYATYKATKSITTAFLLSIIAQRTNGSP